MWGGCYLAKGSESASLPGPAAVVGEALKASEFTSVRAARMVGQVLHGEHWVKLTNGSESASPTGAYALASAVAEGRRIHFGTAARMVGNLLRCRGYLRHEGN